MAETSISWTHTERPDGSFTPGYSFNPWTGCTRVSPGCDNCYAEVMSRRNSSTFGSWTPGAPRKRTSAAYWKGPIKWNRDAERAARRAKVFCASMADIFDNKAPDEWRTDLWALIRATPWLQWQLLTKRPQNIAKMLPPDWGHGFHNVWLGATAENQAELDRRWPHLSVIPAVVRFLSCEPLLGRLTLPMQNPDWVIVGGESGGGARPMFRHWAADLIEQCRQRRIPAFFKQVGSNRKSDWKDITGKGDDPTEWAPFFRIQQFPAEAPDA